MFQTNREKRANRAAEINSLKGHAKGNYSFNGNQNVGKNTNRSKVNRRDLKQPTTSCDFIFIIPCTILIQSRVRWVNSVRPLHARSRNII